MAIMFQSHHARPSPREYLAMGLIIAGGVILILWVIARPAEPADRRELILPMCAMFSLTAAVWLLMVLFRNVAVLFGSASIAYFRDYKSDQPHEKIERSARTFNNLMQVPALFYVICLLMTVFPWVDRDQIALAWIYVTFRALHAIIYIAFNYVPFRFATFAVSCITLAVMWGRFALHS